MNSRLESGFQAACSSLPCSNPCMARAIAMSGVFCATPDDTHPKPSSTRLFFAVPLQLQSHTTLHLTQRNDMVHSTTKRPDDKVITSQPTTVYKNGRDENLVETERHAVSTSQQSQIEAALATLPTAGVTQ